MFSSSVNVAEDFPEIEPQNCPFCGSENLNDTITHTSDLHFIGSIRCRDCRLRAPSGETPHQSESDARRKAYRTAVENWNRLSVET